MVVGRQGVEADLGMLDRGVGQRGEVAAEEAADDRQAIDPGDSERKGPDTMRVEACAPLIPSVFRGERQKERAG